MSEIRKDIFTDRWVIVEESEGVAADGLSLQEIRKGYRLLPLLREQRGRDDAGSLRNPKAGLFS